MYIFTPFPKTISLFLRRFFQKILSLCMACIQEQLLIKSGIWWRTYGVYKLRGFQIRGADSNRLSIYLSALFSETQNSGGAKTS